MRPSSRGARAWPAAWLAVQVAATLPGSWACARPDGDQAPGEPRKEERVQPAMWTGSFHLLWGDPPPGPPGSPQARYQLIPDTGPVVRLQIADSLLAPLGGPRGLDGKRVLVVGEPANEPGGAVRVRSIRPAP
jgi:hypothetical protein